MQKNGGNLGGDSDQVMKGANFVRYQQTKLANVAFTYALHKRLQEAGSKVKALVAHPGVAPTQLAQGTMKAGGANDLARYPQWVSNVFSKVMRYGVSKNAFVACKSCAAQPIIAGRNRHRHRLGLLLHCTGSSLGLKPLIAFQIPKPEAIQTDRYSSTPLHPKP